MADIFDSTFDDQYGQMHYWLNLSNAAGEQVELVAKQRDSRNPALVRDADNRDLHPDTNGRVAPNLRDAINRDPGIAAYFKDELPKWDAAARKLFGMGSEDVFMQAIENEVGSHGLGLSDDLSEKRRELYLNRKPNVRDDRSSSKFFRSVVVRAAEEIQKAKVADETDKLTRTNGVMRALDMTVPGWRKGSDDQIREDLAHASDVLGIKTDDITPEEIRETKGYDYEAAVNFFGVRDIVQAWDAVRRPYTPEDLVDVNENSPLDLQLAKLRMLEEERESLKESTWGERIVNGVLSSIPFVAEFAATGGIAGIAGRSPELAMKLVMRGMGWNMLKKAPGKFLGKAARAAGIAALGAAKRIPMYIPKNMAQAVNEKYYGGSVTMPVGDGKLSIEVPDEQVSNLFQGFVSNMVQQYIENFSEDLGALVPYGNLDAKMIAGWFPKETRNAVMQKLAWNPATKRLFSRVIMENVPFNGALGEFAEEEIGNMMSYFTTALMEAVGFNEDNTPGTKTLFMGGQESLDTMAIIVLQSAMFRTAAVVSNNARGRGALGLIENANRVKEQGQKMDEVSDMIADTRLVGASIPQAKQAVDSLRGGDAILHIDAEDAGNVLYQAVEADDKETLGALQELGITKESVDWAQKKGDDLLVSQNLLFVLGTNKHFKTGRDVMHKLWDLSAQSVFGANVKDLTGSSFEKAQLERLTGQAEEDRKFMTEIRSIVFSSLKTAAKNAHDAGAEISPETAQNWVSIVSAIQNYIVGNTTEEGWEEVKKMLTGLSIQFAENPGTFDPKAARAQMLGNAIADAAKQEIGSGETSLDQVAAGFKKIGFKPGTVNLDLGGGKFDRGTEYLAGKGVTNLVYDPVNRSAESNQAIFDAVKNGGVDTVTCNNVLNVIKEEGARSNVILQAAKALKPGGVAYFTVYEGDGSGNGHETSKGWQEHRKTADYVDEIKQHFSDVVRHGKVIEARNPQTEGKTSAWFNEGFGTTPTLYQNGPAVKGQIDTTKFAKSREAVVTLFQKADASTLPHESAHWLKTMMESLIEGGFATPKMEEDLAAINQWLDKQDYSEEVAKKYGLLDKDGKVMMGAMREEFFARAFEAYIRDGKFPVGAEKGLKAALYRLGRLLRSIYLDAAGLNVQMDDSIRAFFNGLFAADYAVKEQSVLSDILRSINEGALAMSKAELADLEKAVAGVREDAQMQAYLNALRDYRDGEQAMKPVWRRDAKAAYAESKAEKALKYVRGGHRISEGFLRDVLKLDDRDIEILKAKRAVAKGGAASVELTGDAEQFKGLSDDAVVTLPADEAAAQDILAKLILGDTGHGGVMRKRFAIPKNVQAEDALYKGYQTAVKFFAKGKPVKKGELISYVSEAIKNLGKQGYRDDSAAPDSLNATIDNGEGGKTELGDLIGETDQAVGGGFSDAETYLDMMSDWTDTLKEGTTKREIADILYELADLGEIEPSNARIWEVYQERGFGAAEKTVYNTIPEVLKSRKDYFKSQGVRYQTAATNAPADIMETMKELGYDDALRLIGDLKLAVGEKQFIREYMARRAEEYKNDFINNSPLWETETGVADYLDAILKALKLTEGMKFSQRVRMEEAVAERELRERTVREVMGSLRSLEMSLRTSAARVLKAVKSNKEDKAAATTAALAMHRHAAQLGAARKLQAAIRRSMRSAERMGNAKQGKSIDGDYLNAILAVRNMFGMSQRKPKWTDGPNDPQTVGGVLRKYIRYIVETELGEVDTTSERHKKLFEEAYDFEMKRWPSWLWETIHDEKSPVDFRDLTMEQFDEVMNFLDFLDGAGRDIRGEEKAAFGARVRDAVESIVQTTTAHNGKRTGQKFGDQKFTEKLRALAQSGMNWEKTLVSLCDMLDEYSEHYGKKLLGPWRRKFQMVLSAGASRQLHWQQKISKDIKPHLRALMDSAKTRKLYAPVKNQMVGGYKELRGAEVAFVLLNAGCVENRERLMSGFGWSEDELNDVLRQFTAEDFKHAEAIWASLREMGEQLAGVFYRDRHYRMPRSESVPIELTNNDGETIFCAGGYYPIDYKVKQSTVGSEVNMDPESIMARPLPPSSTYKRQTHVDGHLLLDPNVLTRHVHDNARYIGMWEPLRFANAVWTNQAVKDAVLLNYGPETYDTLRKLMQHVNVPENREATSLIQRWGASILPTAALAYKFGPILSQLQSITVGAERLGRYFWSSFFEFHAHPVNMRRRVAELSPFMRDRYNQRERDLKDIGTEFDNAFVRAVDWYRRVGFFGLKLLDLHVAGIQWWAAYNQALSNEANNLTPHEAAVFADDFVASTQGAARVVDVPEVQLNAFMRTLTPFFGPAVAAFNSRMAVLSSLKKMDVGEAVEAVIMTILVPAILAGVKGGLLQGPSSGDDDDDWGRVQRGFVRGLLSDVTSGIPIVQDISDAVVSAAQTNGKSLRNGNIFEASTLRPANDAAKEAFDLATHFDNHEYAAYVGTSLVSEILGIPFVSAYENWEKFTLRHFGDSDSKTLKQNLKQQGGNR